LKKHASAQSTKRMTTSTLQAVSLSSTVVSFVASMFTASKLRVIFLLTQEISFWSRLGKNKLEEYKLDNGPKPITGAYALATHKDVSCEALSHDALLKHPCPLAGRLRASSA
jgi:hypothetical protein